MKINFKHFQVDVSLYHETFGLLASSTYKGMETPIFLRGLILEDENKQKMIIATVEYCIIGGYYYQSYKRILSEATETTIDKITLHVSHQHDVPWFDELYHGTLYRLKRDPYPITLWEDYLIKIKEDIKQELKKGISTEVTQVSFQLAEVEQYASDRRIYQEGKMNWRSTKCQNVFLKSLPLGIVDPNLYQCIFWSNDKRAVACLNFFACHPQVADGRGLLSSDAPGVALKRMKQFLPNCFTMYFNGCGADIGNGKFAGTSKEQDLEIFGEKIFQAMKTAYHKSAPEEIKEMEWFNREFDITLKKPDESLEELMLAFHAKDFDNNPKKWHIIRKIGLIHRDHYFYSFLITKLRLNQNQILFFPGEMFLAYQRYCMEKFSGKTCVAAYGDGLIGYVPEDSDFLLGGYEIETCFQISVVGNEKKIKEQIDILASK